MKPLQIVKTVILSVICSLMFIALLLGAIYQQQYRAEMQLVRYSNNG